MDGDQGSRRRDLGASSRTGRTRIASSRCGTCWLTDTEDGWGQGLSLPRTASWTSPRPFMGLPPLVATVAPGRRGCLGGGRLRTRLNDRITRDAVDTTARRDHGDYCLLVASKPSVATRWTASARVRQSSFASALPTCISTVRGLMKSARPISRLVRPRATYRMTSSSRRRQTPVGQPARLPAAQPTLDRLAEAGQVRGDPGPKRGGAQAAGGAGGRDQGRDPLVRRPTRTRAIPARRPISARS